jgi:hypothetical protein
MPFQFKENSKFALLAISGIGSTLPDAEYQLGDGTWVMPRLPAVADLGKWREWIGSIRADELQRANLVLLLEEDAPDPMTLNDTHYRLRDAVCHLCYCFQLRPGIESRDPDLLLGSSVDGQVFIRQMSKLHPFHQSKGYTAASVSQEWVEEALALRTGIERMLSAGGYARFHRGLDVLFKALRQKAQERLHEVARAIEALILPERGRTERQFVHRCQTFARANEATATVLGEIFGMRSDAEHLQDWNLAVEAYPEDERENVCWQRTRQVEHLACNAYSKLLLSPALLNHFRTDDTINQFWHLRDDERRHLWGEGLDITAEPLVTDYDQWGRAI